MYMSRIWLYHKRYNTRTVSDPVCLSLPRGVAPPSAADDVTPHGEPWFHGKITRHEVEALLQQDGHFLVRESTHSPGQYVLSGRHQGRIKHLLLIDPEGIVSTARSCICVLMDDVTRQSGSGTNVGLSLKYRVAGTM